MMYTTISSHNLVFKTRLYIQVTVNETHEVVNRKLWFYGKQINNFDDIYC